MTDQLLRCPECESDDVTVSYVEMIMVNTGEHYCHSVKPQDPDSEATCLCCEWRGGRGQLVTNFQSGE